MSLLEDLTWRLEDAARARRDSIAASVAWAFFSLLLGALAFTRSLAPSVIQLGSRWAFRQGPRLSAAVVRAIVCAFGGIALVVAVLGGGAGGVLWGACVAALWLLAALERRSYAARTRAALAPVLDAPRRALAEATGTVVLAVRACARDRGVRSLLGDDVVAFSELRIREGPRLLSGPRELVHRERDDLEIVDDSGEGVLHLDGAILHTSVRRARIRRLPPRLAERGILSRTALYYVVEERVVVDGEPLSVLGHISGVELRAGVGYRRVKRAPAVGGPGAPVAVFSGEDLVATLSGSARAASVLSMSAAISGAALIAALALLTAL